MEVEQGIEDITLQICHWASSAHRPSREEKITLQLTQTLRTCTKRSTSCRGQTWRSRATEGVKVKSYFRVKLVEALLIQSRIQAKSSMNSFARSTIPWIHHFPTSSSIEMWEPDSQEGRMTPLFTKSAIESLLSSLQSCIGQHMILLH
jgi:hypothetical protein